MGLQINDQGINSLSSSLTIHANDFTFTALGFMPIDRIRDSEELSEFSSYSEKTYIGYFKKQTQKVLRLLY